MMDNRPLGIVVAAVGISDEVRDRFKATLQKTLGYELINLHMAIKLDEFSRAKARNDGILAALSSSRAIVCTDVDMLVPPGLVEHTRRTVADGTAVWAKCRNLPAERAGELDWKGWLGLPIREDGTGSWVAMTAADWLRVGGWDERLTGHGGEDDILALRRRERGIETVELRQFPLMHVDHPPRDQRILGGNLENLRIGRMQPPKNYLTNRLPVLDHQNNHFNFFTTARCTRDCPECSQRGFRRWAPDYELSLNDLVEWIQLTKASGYPPYRSLILTGGEPLLWPHVEEGARLLRESGLGDQVNLFTNGDPVDRVTDGLMESLSTLRISYYGDNNRAIRRLQERYGAKVEVAPRRRHYLIPRELAGSEVLPARCGCEGPALLGDRVYGCAMLVTVANEFGLDLARYPESHCRLQVGYLELLAGFPRTRHDCCRGCIGNLAFRQQTVSATG
jgi:hypothetical protein